MSCHFLHLTAILFLATSQTRSASLTPEMQECGVLNKVRLEILLVFSLTVACFQLTSPSSVTLVMFVWLVELLNLKADWKFVLTTFGVQSVTMDGITQMLQLLAINWDIIVSLEFVEYKR